MYFFSFKDFVKLLTFLFNFFLELFYGFKAVIFVVAEDGAMWANSFFFCNAYNIERFFMGHAKLDILPTLS